MNEVGEFYHALKINEELCVGCTHCVSKCPTGALRIRDGKATIRPNWCIDCGDCMKICPKGAIFVEQNELQQIFDYKCRVVLVPAIFLGQFSDKYSENEIFEALYTLGFTNVYQVEFSIDIVRQEMAKQIKNATEKPAISSFCPAIVRLIQIKYSGLVDNIIRVTQPIVTTAKLYREKLRNKGFEDKEIGIFYITPCAAKIASIKGVSEYSELIDGVLNMDFLYNKVYHILRNGLKNESVSEEDRIMPPTIGAEDMCWSQTSGESSCFEGRCLAIDEIHNVIEFIDRMEITEDMPDIDFLELRACDRSCVGGLLTPANRFLAAERIARLSHNHPQKTQLYNEIDQETVEKLNKEVQTEKYAPVIKLVYEGEDISDVLRKMSSAKQILELLPGIDCGACGSPCCESLAEDIVRGEATLNSCVFIQKEREKKGKLSYEGVC